jgi:pyruvate dehydrogenase E2 component (dihydrolipoyllysine-residue acetyltransferase)
MSEHYIVRPLSPMRRVIAARMTEAKRTIPHFRLSAEIEVDALLLRRTELRQARPGSTLSLNDLLIKACAQALMDVPDVNVQWADNELHQFASADISIVTAVEGGLVTPIVRGAEAKSIWQISSEVRELAARAARNELKMQEIVGGSFSISNLGMHGVDEFDAVINPPQCAILAIGAARSRCVVSRDLEPQVATVMRVTLSADHRAIDGVVGARFLTALKRRIESPLQIAAAPVEQECSA